MAISGKYYIKKWLPEARLVHGDDFQGGGPGGPPPEGGMPGGPGGPPPEGGMPGGPGGPPPAGGAPGGPAPAAGPQVELKDHGTPGENFFEGDMTFDFVPHEDGSLTGTADGTPINWGWYTGDEFFKVDYNAGPGKWEVWARVDADGYIEGMISVGGGQGKFPNLVYGKKLD